MAMDSDPSRRTSINIAKTWSFDDGKLPHHRMVTRWQRAARALNLSFAFVAPERAETLQAVVASELRLAEESLRN